MSSQEEDYKLGPRMKRKGRACDLCRHKKVKCDGIPGERCANCAAAQQECTYLRDAKKRYPDAERIKSLETELANYKKLLNKLHPGVDFSRELNGVLGDNSLWLLDAKNAGSSSQNPMRLPTPPSAPSPNTNSRHADDVDSSDDEIALHMDLKRSMQALTLHSEFPRYLGKSSRLMLFKQAYDLRNSYAGIDSQGNSLFNERLRMSLNRNKYLRSQPWISAALETGPVPDYTWPPEDLMTSLIDIYFDELNVLLPLLHRPTFQTCVDGALHHEDEGFASLLMLVCACGSRFSKDPRVLADGSDNWHSAGWRYFSQVQSTRKGINLRPPRLYDIQIPCLIQLFLHGSCVTQPSWGQVGLGLRLAQDMGAHRRKSYGNMPSVEGELMKRAFWMLVAFDRSLSFNLGRACIIEDEDMDVDFPAECDDEYWTHADPEQAFKQPPGKPSTVAFFICTLRLKQIHAFALRTIYSTKKARVMQGHIGPEWEQHMVSELDSALNEWVDSVPDHLKWDPHQPNNLFLKQSAFLYSSYYSTQINIHRAFIPSPRKPSCVSFPSLAICTNAARSCIHVLDVQYRLCGGSYLNLASLFCASIVLLLNIWGGKRAGASINPMKEMAEVHKAMEMLRAKQSRFYAAMRYWEILHDLANVGDLPLPEASEPREKRPRPADEGLFPPLGPDEPRRANGQRTIAGSRRVTAAYQQGSASAEPPSVIDAPGAFSPSMDFVLPMHCDELRQMPIFPAQHPPPPAPGPSTAPHAWAPYDLSPSVFGAPLGNGAPLPSAVPHSAFVGPLGGAGLAPADVAAASPFAPSSFASAPFGGAPGDVSQLHPAHAPPDPAGAGAGVSGDTLAMWSSAPEGFEWDEWGMFISAMNAPVHGAQEAR